MAAFATSEFLGTYARTSTSLDLKFNNNVNVIVFSELFMTFRYTFCSLEHPCTVTPQGASSTRINKCQPLNQQCTMFL
jgi:hypothetical protein